MQKKNVSLAALLFLFCVFSASLILFSNVRIRNAEERFNKEKAALVKESLDLKDRLDYLQEAVDRLAIVEREKMDMEKEVKLLKEENAKLKDSYNDLKLSNDSTINEMKALSEQLASLEKKNKSLEETISQLEASPIGKISEGKSVSLSTIVVKGVEQPLKLPGELQSAEKVGKISLVDAKNSLIVIDRGIQDEIKKGDRCIVLKNKNAIASGVIMNVRYKESAVFIEDLYFGNRIGDLKEGYEVLVKREM